MALYDDLLDRLEDGDLDEDELEDLREERRYTHQAKKKYEKMREEHLAAYTQSIFVAGPEYVEAPYVHEVPWLVEGLIPLGSLVILGGTSKSGKTCLATALAMAVAKGEPFLGMPTGQSAVLWCAYEETRIERWRLMGCFGEPPANFYTTHAELKIDDDFGINTLRWWVDNLNCSLIVIDPLFGATDCNLADGRAARKALIGLKRLAGQTGATVLILHHVNKETSAGLTRERFAESNQILATASMDILMDSKDKPARGGEKGYREIRLQCRGRGDFANQTLLIRSNSAAHFELVANGNPAERKAELQNDTIRVVLQEAGVPMDAEEIAAQCNAPVGSVRNRLTSLKKEGTVKVVGKRDKANLFALV